ncbi:MAG: hypothetical protein A2275_14350 [Bacteroidetes bacterium RIFOXYA12_FULL_35_11]|nr:MAG: hypothetical protein A2X01_03270 [Bacteroidetes bacterium GWF2_35_48]OFY76022.1 MAG: hypothetical protein A2275_14350 [Bacteroidetes bacterium RIFOXYA12_FULL_35_11]OFY92560.1 MAG: hypothetical protein A2309_00690 [Bacteroidetes bacterium RIFOXYB2_FULL_35_7]OFY93769.1 MAG: hypothetical protein A2491_04020 [Bacteroidetes bacterium RIFOXYC12_FULL_35_7]HBX51443.1 hypothetical protein [Bacteroidales bacterium]
MWYIAVLIIIFLAGAFFLATGTKGNSSEKYSEQAPPDSGKKIISRQELVNKLQKLSDTEAPKNLEMGAMCYKTAGPPERAEYVCPKCGEKTIYHRNNTRFIEKEIPACRGLVSKIKDMEISLDESEYCRKCSPSVTEPELCIYLRTSDMEKPDHVCGISSDDLNVLSEFLSGSLKVKDNYDYESPLKEKISTIERILKIKLAK